MSNATLFGGVRLTELFADKTTLARGGYHILSSCAFSDHTSLPDKRRNSSSLSPRLRYAPSRSPPILPSKIDSPLSGHRQPPLRAASPATRSSPAPCATTCTCRAPASGGASLPSPRVVAVHDECALQNGQAHRHHDCVLCQHRSAHDVRVLHYPKGTMS